MEIKKVELNHPDFLCVLEKMEEYLDEQYVKYNTKVRAKYRSDDAKLTYDCALVAYDGEEPIGSCAYKIIDDTTAELKKVFVLPEFTGDGIATSLVHMVEDDAKAAGITKMILKTSDPLRKAVNLYEQLGYAFIPNFAPYEDDPMAICMQKSLIKDAVTWDNKSRNHIIEALGYINMFRGKVFVLKLDGSVIAHAHEIEVLKDIKILSECGIKIILVYGGKPEIEAKIAETGLVSETYNGERITSAKVLELIKEVYIEKIGPRISRQLREVGITVSGRNMNFLQCKKKKINETALGMVGEIKSVDATILNNLLNCGLVPIVTPLGIDEHGHTCNILPEHVALQIAREMQAEKLIFITKQDGITDSDGKVINEIDLEHALELKAEKKVSENMFPKIDAATYALSYGVQSVHIINGLKSHSLFDEIISHSGVGTMFMNVSAARERRMLIDKMKGGDKN